jgi:hypothetical protein
MGVRPVLYTNGRIMDPQSDFYRSGGKSSRCISAQGAPAIETYSNSVKFEVACPMSDAFRQQMVRRVEAVVGQYGAVAIQIDQISSADAIMCHDSTHGHTRPSSNFLPGYDRLLQEVQAAGRAINPDFFIWVEGCHERFAQYYDVSQSGDEGDGCGLDVPRPEQFPFVYPHLKVTGPAGSVNLLCHSFCQGKALDIPADKLADERLCSQLRTFVALRKAMPEYFLRGTFRDNVGVDVAGQARAFRIVRDDGKADMVNLWVRGAGEDQACRAYLRATRGNGLVTSHYPAKVNIEQHGEWSVVEWTGPVAVVTIG